LKHYPGKDTVSELTAGFLNGFKLHYTGPRFHRESSNLVSASQHKDELFADHFNDIVKRSVTQLYKDQGQ
jgi:hypothetical protein